MIILYNWKVLLESSFNQQQIIGCISFFASVEGSFLLCQRFMPHQLSKDNRPIIPPLLLMLLHAKNIWRNMHVFQCGSFAKVPLQVQTRNFSWKVPLISKN